MNKEEQEFFEGCDVFKDYQSVEEYRADIRRYLTLSSWHYSAEMADEIMSMPGRARAIEQAFEEKEPAADIAVDVGYFCG